MNEEKEALLLDLLCKKAIYGLSGEEEKQLAELQAAAGDELDVESFELTAAALSVAGVERNAQLPPNLQARIAADAERYFDELEDKPSTVAAATPPISESRPSWFGWLGWAAAAAACIALAVNIYTTRSTTEIARPEPTPTPAPQQLTPEQMRERLIRTAPDLTKASIAAGNVKEMRPAGDIVWSDAAQSGYIRVTGLPKNDPGRETYQLWIFDETQDPKTPIDGGTFDIDSDGEAVIPIDPRLKPKNPNMFAITVEKPGGVVVSKQEKVAALAKRET